MEAASCRGCHHHNIPTAEQQSYRLLGLGFSPDQEHSITSNTQRNDWLRHVRLHIVLVAIQRVACRTTQRSMGCILQKFMSFQPSLTV